MVRNMASSDEPGEGDGCEETLPSADVTQFLLSIRHELRGREDLYDEFVHVMLEIRKQIANPDVGTWNISIEDVNEMVAKVLVGETRLIGGFQHLSQGLKPFDDDPRTLRDPISFLQRLKTCPDVRDGDYDAFVGALCWYIQTKAITVDNLFQEVKGFIRCPELLEEFKSYLPPDLTVPLPQKRSCKSLKTSRVGKAVLSSTLDANHSLDGTNSKNKASQLEYPQDGNHDFREFSFGHEETESRHLTYTQKHTQRGPDFVQNHTKEGNEESLLPEENEGDKVEALPEWNPFRENKLPSKVDLGICTPCTPSYRLLPENYMTLQSSYQTELGRSIFNDALVSVTSGSEDCFKFRTKNQYEENILKCEDDMFESDMLLLRFRTTADFIENLQARVDSKIKITEHLTPLHKRCIEHLYDGYGPDMFDVLSENQNTSAALDIILYRLNQKIKDLSEARLSLNKTCSDIIANNYYRSLDHHSPSFKQLDIKRMSPKALLAEAKEINKAKLNARTKPLTSVCNNQHSLISDIVLNYTDLHIHDDMRSIVYYASSRSCTSEEQQCKLMMIWTELVQPFLGVNFQWPELKDSIALKEVCERCGFSKVFSSRILDAALAHRNVPVMNVSTGAAKPSINDALLANKFLLPSKRGECPGNKSNECNYLHHGFDAEIEEGEFIPNIENIQLDAMLGTGKGAAGFDVAAFSGYGSSFRCLATDTSGRGTCDHGNESEEQHESREDSSIEMGSLLYSQRIAKPHDVKGGISCCSLVVLFMLHQVLYERLLAAKVLLRDASTPDLYAGFKEKLCNLLDGSIDNWYFEEYCLKFLGSKSYILFTLDKLISRIIKQLCRIYSNDEDSLLLQLHEKSRRPNPSEELLLHCQNARGSPTRLSTGLLEQDGEEQEKGSKPFNSTGKAKQNHFQRRKKRKLENGAASSLHPGVEN